MSLGVDGLVLSWDQLRPKTASKCPQISRGFRWIFPNKKPKNPSIDGGYYPLVGGLNPSEKYESQLGWLFPIYGKIKNVPNHQPVHVPVGFLLLIEAKPSVDSPWSHLDLDCEGVLIFPGRRDRISDLPLGSWTGHRKALPGSYKVVPPSYKLVYKPH